MERVFFSFGVIFAGTVAPPIGKLFILTFIVSQFFCARSQRTASFPYYGLGAALPFSGILGASALLSAGYAALLFNADSKRTLSAVWAYPFLIVMWVSVLVRVFGEFSLEGLSSLSLGVDGVSSWGDIWWRALGNAHLPYLEGVVMALRWSLIPFWCGYIHGDSRRAPPILWGALWGGLAGAGLLIGEWGSGEPFFFSTPIWRSLGRYGAAFSDPNSAGIFLVFVLALVMTTESIRKYLKVPSAIIVVIGGFFTGSRSFVLGAVLLALFYCVKKGRKGVVGIALGTVVIVVVLFTSCGTFLSTSVPTFGRLCDSASPAHAASAFYSRKLFFEIALQVWADHPFVGIGFERFRDEVVPFTVAHGINTGEWSDNANSLYLQIGAELGLLGIAAFLFSICQIRLRSEGVYAPLVMVFLILCVVGPHLAFDEIALLFGTILGISIEAAERRFSQAWFFLPATPLLIAMISVQSVRDLGFYGWERDKRVFYRWTSGRGGGMLRCSSDGTAHLKIRAVNARYRRGVPEITFTTPLIEEKVTLARGEERSLILSCGTFHELPYRFSVKGVWSPHTLGIGNDGRALGVQLLGGLND